MSITLRAEWRENNLLQRNTKTVPTKSQKDKEIYVQVQNIFIIGILDSQICNDYAIRW